ncbi:unnamed protein product [Nesidiocoris tenuis]|uniref:Uncharacterized protein n=1 Tax=Nesidiocoris tenuis TaxID=355587 RepID=A0A6H5GQ91_9HEMI|nr:unnamed protein product [Nesidiocoris tenuis]
MSRNLSVVQGFLKRGAKLGPTTWTMAKGKHDVISYDDADADIQEALLLCPSNNREIRRILLGLRDEVRMEQTHFLNYRKIKRTVHVKRTVMRNRRSFTIAIEKIDVSLYSVFRPTSVKEVEIIRYTCKWSENGVKTFKEPKQLKKFKIGSVQFTQIGKNMTCDDQDDPIFKIKPTMTIATAIRRSPCPTITYCGWIIIGTILSLICDAYPHSTIIMHPENRQLLNPCIEPIWPMCTGSTIEILQEHKPPYGSDVPRCREALKTMTARNRNRHAVRDRAGWRWGENRTSLTGFDVGRRRRRRRRPERPARQVQRLLIVLLLIVGPAEYVAYVMGRRRLRRTRVHMFVPGRLPRRRRHRLVVVVVVYREAFCFCRGLVHTGHSRVENIGTQPLAGEPPDRSTRRIPGPSAPAGSLGSLITPADPEACDNDFPRMALLSKVSDCVQKTADGASVCDVDSKTLDFICPIFWTRHQLSRTGRE